jgi:hypothetical protein
MLIFYDDANIDQKWVTDARTPQPQFHCWTRTNISASGSSDRFLAANSESLGAVTVCF